MEKNCNSVKNDPSDSRFFLELHFLLKILGNIRKKMALRASKMNKRAIFTTFSLFLALKTALEFIFLAGWKVSYDVLSSEIMLMGQAGPGRY